MFSSLFCFWSINLTVNNDLIKGGSEKYFFIYKDRDSAIEIDISHLKSRHNSMKLFRREPVELDKGKGVSFDK